MSLHRWYRENKTNEPIFIKLHQSPKDQYAFYKKKKTNVQQTKNITKILK